MREKRPNPKDAGFSMIEMLVVVTIVALTIATASRSFIHRDHTPDLHDVASKIQSLVYMVRTEAMLTGSASQMWIDVEGKSAGVDGGDRVQIPTAFSLNVTAARELIDSDGLVKIVFLPDGGSSGAKITLTDGDEESATVSVDWLTGVPLLTRGEASP
ncbi:MAG: GspH/FimT family pseudopilin [Pseudomonadota bacterium]